VNVLRSDPVISPRGVELPEKLGISQYELRIRSKIPIRNIDFDRLKILLLFFLHSTSLKRNRTPRTINKRNGVCVSITNIEVKRNTTFIAFFVDGVSKKSIMPLITKGVTA
jgi:hypothetical protein